MTTQRVTLPGHIVPAFKGIRPIGTIAPRQTIHLSIGLTLRNQPLLHALLQQQNDQSSKLFHHYLTPDEFAQQFGPLPAATRAVGDFLASLGLHITSVSPNHAFMFADGTAAAVEKAFVVHLADFSYNGSLFYGPTNNPSVPAALGGIVQNIVGLDNVAIARHTPLIGHVSASVKRTHHQLHPLNVICPTNGYYPGDFWDGYDARTLITNGYTGVGETVDVVEFDGYNLSDVTGFDQCTGLGPLSSQVEFGGSQSTSQTVNGGLEADTDIEVLQGMAYSAEQLLYFGSSTVNPKTDNVSIGAFDVIPVYAAVAKSGVAHNDYRPFRGHCHRSHRAAKRRAGYRIVYRQLLWPIGRHRYKWWRWM